MKKELQGFELRIKGRVQGVGFRPFLCRIANELNLFGQVFNNEFGVVIRINSDEETLVQFKSFIIDKSPVNARVDAIETRAIKNHDYSTFSISESKSDEPVNLFIPPDYAICQDCLQEIDNADDRRHNYSFTTCINCGPRYSVLNSMPYDRERSSFSELEICETCETEYSTIQNKRAHAQTLSCPACAISMRLLNEGNIVGTSLNEILNRSKDLINKGELIAIKGMTGFLLCCDAKNEHAIKKLRTIKGRYHKPLAVMYPSLDAIKENCFISEYEEKTLLSHVRPIVLLKPMSHELPSELNFGLDKIGVFLPNNALLYLICKKLDRPIVVTSANFTDEPILFKSENLVSIQALTQNIIDHNIMITMPQDDSVMQIAPESNQKIILRRSRGLAPEVVRLENKNESIVLCLGGDIKNTVCLANKEMVYLSQSIGNQESLSSQQRILDIIDYFLRLLNIKPDHIICDLNQSYFTHQMALDLSQRFESQLASVPHHEAHFCAILGEHELWSADNVLGVIWDGQGLGADGNIWGGEFFIKDNDVINRTHHFDYFPWILGDKMSKEPRLSAMSFLGKEEGLETVIKSKFEDKEWSNFNQVRESNNLFTSSVGRMFDAIASLLGVCDINHYEGQAAMELEALASKCIGGDRLQRYGIEVNGSAILLSQMKEELVKSILDDTKENVAYRFHLTLVECIRIVAEKQGVNDIAFSGGVFQNALLVDLLILKLSNKFKLYFHSDLSPNDENISYGQLMYHIHINNG